MREEDICFTDEMEEVKQISVFLQKKIMYNKIVELIFKRESIMKKKVFVILVVIILSIGGYALYKAINLDPSINSIEEMDVMKFEGVEHFPMFSIEENFKDKDKGNIAKILNALKDRSRKNDKVLLSNSKGYSIDMMYKEKSNEEILTQYKYKLWVKDESVYITLHSNEQKCYKLGDESAKIIIEYMESVVG